MSDKKDEKSGKELEEDKESKRQVLTEDKPGHLSQDEFGKPEYDRAEADKKEKEKDDKDYRGEKQKEDEDK